MKTVLVVDDFASVRFYHENLLKQAGFATLAAKDGLLALSVIDSKPVDLVMLDLLMPNMNGCEFIKRLRQNPRFKALPIIVITSEQNHESLSEIRADAACTVLIKPILPVDLVLEVKRRLGNA